MMRFKSLTIVFLFAFQFSYGAVFTFHTAGSYTNASNWDVYPGTELSSNDTISIEADCDDINLFAYNGYVVFSEDVSSVRITQFVVLDGCQLEFKSDFFFMEIGWSFEYYCSYPILIPEFSYIEMSNGGQGISSNTCIFEAYVDIGYINDGTQDAFFLECMNGFFSNLGTIEVSSSDFYLNCNLELNNGVINGIVPFDFYQFNGTISQQLPFLSTVINNIEQLYLNSGTTNISGTLTLNAPED